jgi:hypothetical protein
MLLTVDPADIDRRPADAAPFSCCAAGVVDPTEGVAAPRRSIPGALAETAPPPPPTAPPALPPTWCLVVDSFRSFISVLRYVMTCLLDDSCALASSADAAAALRSRCSLETSVTGVLVEGKHS